MISRHSQKVIDEMRPAGKFVARVLEEVSAAAEVGANLLDLDAIARDAISGAGAISCYVDYHPSFGGSPFGKNICTSVNDAALHGLPHDYFLEAGDLLSLDFAASLHGWVADSAVSIVVGQKGTPEDHQLIATCEAALEAGISEAVEGKHLGDISYAIGNVAKSAGYLVNSEFGGHGVGRTMHQDPSIPNCGKPGTGPVLRNGMVFAIEPWIMASTDRVFTDADGWTLRSVDGSRSAHVEHTVAVTHQGPLVLTARS